jgi:hypothetical protein
VLPRSVAISVAISVAGFVERSLERGRASNARDRRCAAGCLLNCRAKKAACEFFPPNAATDIRRHQEARAGQRGDRQATDFDASQGGADFNRRPFLHPEFREALLAIAGDRGSISGKRLGKWLSANKGKMFDGLRIVRDGILDGVARYRPQSFDGERWE